MSDEPTTGGKGHDQSLLDVFASGFASGYSTALLHAGADPAFASAAAQARVADLAGDPLATDMLVGELRTLYAAPYGTVAQPGDGKIEVFRVYTRE